MSFYWVSQKEQEEFTENFVEECAFAKVVSTTRGHAILINGTVIDVSCSIAEFDVADALVRALRRGQIGKGEITQGAVSTAN